MVCVFWGPCKDPHCNIQGVATPGLLLLGFPAMEPLSKRQVDRGRSPGPSKGSGGDEGGFRGAGGPSGPPKGTLGFKAPQVPQDPGVMVITQGANKVLGTSKPPNPDSPLRPPVSVVTAQGPQEVKQGVPQDPHQTTTKIPKGLQTQVMSPTPLRWTGGREGQGW